MKKKKDTLVLKTMSIVSPLALEDVLIIRLCVVWQRGSKPEPLSCIVSQS